MSHLASRYLKACLVNNPDPRAAKPDYYDSEIIAVIKGCRRGREPKSYYLFMQNLILLSKHFFGMGCDRGDGKQFVMAEV